MSTLAAISSDWGFAQTQMGEMPKLTQQWHVRKMTNC
jgi:hypothetical protein